MRLRRAMAVVLLVAAGCGRDKEPPSPTTPEATKPDPKPAPKVKDSDPPPKPKPVRRRHGDQIAGWGVITDPDGDCSFFESEGMVSIGIPGSVHDINPTKNSQNSPRILRGIQGDFRLVVRVTGDFQPLPPSTARGSAPFNGAGLVAYADRSNLAIVNRNQFIINANQHVCFAPLFEVFQDGRSVLGNAPIVPAETFHAESTALYLERSGKVLKGAYSQDAKTWAGWRESACALPDKIQVGVVSISTSSRPFTVTFDGFKLLDE